MLNKPANIFHDPLRPPRPRTPCDFHDLPAQNLGDSDTSNPQDWRLCHWHPVSTHSVQHSNIYAQLFGLVSSYFIPLWLLHLGRFTPWRLIATHLNDRVKKSFVLDVDRSVMSAHLLTLEAVSCLLQLSSYRNARVREVNQWVKEWIVNQTLMLSPK